jgi:cell division protein FtsB
MTGPSQRAAERRRARRGSAASSSAGSAAATAASRRPTLTGRAVVLALVVGMLVLTLAVPLRELLAQRAEINALRAANEATQARVDELTVRQERLKDPAYITTLVRERLHYVLPGEVGYVVLDPQEAPAPALEAAKPAAVAWYARLWQSVETADQAARPSPAPSGPAPARTDAPR